MKISILKLSVLSALIFACSGISSAQLRYGFNFGGSFAEARLSDASGFSLDNRSGFRGGLVLEYQLPSSGLAFDGSVLYHRYNTRLIEHSNDARSAFGRNFIELMTKNNAVFLHIPETSGENCIRNSRNILRQLAETQLLRTKQLEHDKKLPFPADDI